MTSSLLKKLLSAFIVLYSIGVIASSTPTFGDISNVLVIVYFMFLPGLAMTLLFKEGYGILERLSFSVILSLGAVLTLLAIRDMLTPSNFPLPFNVIIPLFTIIVTSYYYFAQPQRVAI